MEDLLLNVLTLVCKRVDLPTGYRILKKFASISLQTIRSIISKFIQSPARNSSFSCHPLCPLSRIRITKDLVQVMPKVAYVVFGNKLQCHRFAIVHIAHVGQRFGVNMLDDVREMLVVVIPNVYQIIPSLSVVALGFYPVHLLIRERP